MRRSTSLPVISDLLSVLAIIALILAVYLCSTPQNFQSMHNRKAKAAVLLASARDHIEREGALFTRLMAVSDPRNAEAVRHSLLDNERQFHVLTLDAIGKLPEVRGAIDDLVIDFDRLAATGWQADASLKQSDPAEAQSVLETRFLPNVTGLIENALAIEQTLQGDDNRLILPLPEKYRAVRVVSDCTDKERLCR